MGRSAPLAEALGKSARVVAAVASGASFDAAFPAATCDLDRTLSAAVRDISMRTLRAYTVDRAVAAKLLRQPPDDTELLCLLQVTLCLLREDPERAHTVVDQAVEAGKALRNGRYTGVINAVLRTFLREAGARVADAEQASEEVRYRHPQWWIDRLRTAFPTQWKEILAANNQHPPMTLRVNRRRAARSQVADVLRADGLETRPVGASGLILERPRALTQVAGFSAGQFSIQDAGAQRAAELLDLADGQRVLDACAAPGGKTTHILELADVQLLALDNDALRLKRVAENLGRLGLRAELAVADCSDTSQWDSGRRFERILLDAPCTASGVARRHPDAKWLRRPSDIGRAAFVQTRMLNALWQLLTPGGKLLYATCSLFTEENQSQIEQFLATQPDACRLALPGIDHGQLVPNHEHDGFFYALLHKQA